MIDGNYTQWAAGTLRSLVASAVNPFIPAQTDVWGGINTRLGSATLDGALVVDPTSGFVAHIGDQIIVLDYPLFDRVGTFATFTDNAPRSGAAVLPGMVLYDATYVDVAAATSVRHSSVDVVWGCDFLPFAETHNQEAVANNLNLLHYYTAANNTLYYDTRGSALLNYLGDLQTGAELRNAYDLIAPEELTSIFNLGFASADVQGYNLLQRMQEIRAGRHGFSSAGFGLYDPSGMMDSLPKFASNLGAQQELAMTKSMLRAESDNPWGVFVGGVGQFARVGSDNNASSFDMDTGGLSVGADYRLSEKLAVGAALGYANTRASLSGNGRVDVNDVRLNAYATYFDEGWHAEAILGGGYGSYDTSRQALLGKAKGETDATGFEMLVGGGYDWRRGPWVFGPQMHLQYTRVNMDGFTEKGSLAPLDIEETAHDAMRMDMIGHVIYVAKWEKVIIMPELRMGWQHNFLDKDLSLESQFANGAAGVFSVNGPEIGADAAVLGVGVSVQWNQTISTYFNYDTQLGRENYQLHSVSAGFRIRL
jgi:outer membrane autotransporter protein